MRVLGIESSCDETAAAVVEDGWRVLSSVIYSQIALHQPYGGVVPEIASRSHVEKLPGIIREALFRACAPGVPLPEDGQLAIPEGFWKTIDAIAVTFGPGLASSLIVGLSAAKGLALALNKPLIAVNHMEGHLHSVRLDCPELKDEDLYPQLGMAVSGGHTCFIDTPEFGVYHQIGQTLDDAAGEAFDKAAKLLGLGYPGGPAIDREARKVLPEKRRAILFPKGRISPDHPLTPGLRPELCVSFSGLKTALMYHLKKDPADTPEKIALVAASYQEAIVGALAERCDLALQEKGYRSLAVGGGVSLNGRLREALEQVARRHGVRLLLAAPKYCGDNAAMIAGLASRGGGVCHNALALDVVPNLEIGNSDDSRK